MKNNREIRFTIPENLFVNLKHLQEIEGDDSLAACVRRILRIYLKERGRL